MSNSDTKHLCIINNCALLQIFVSENFHFNLNDLIHIWTRQKTYTKLIVDSQYRVGVGYRVFFFGFRVSYICFEKIEKYHGPSCVLYMREYKYSDMDIRIYLSCYKIDSKNIMYDYLNHVYHIIYLVDLIFR